MFRATGTVMGCCALEYSEPLGTWERQSARRCSARTDLELVVAVDPAAAGRPLDEVAALHGSGLEIAPSPAAVSEAGAEVMVDFTVAAAARDNLRWCADHGVHVVCGTTGFDEADLEALRARFSGDAHAIVAANFSIGAALMMRCAEVCAPWVGGAEVVELHHDHKRDAPSGTSLETIRRMQGCT
jgi:4-hydroxy-tetrahydrodipicolinate reductase